MPRISDRSTMWAIASVAALLLVLVVAQVVGVRGRTALPEQQVVEVTSAKEAYTAVKELGVRGRVLVLLDDRSRIVPRTWMATFMESLSDRSVEPPVMSHNLTSAFVYSGVAREVYFVPPDGSWDAELERMGRRPDALPEGNGARARFFGVPVHLTRSADLPFFREKVIVYVSPEAESRYAPDVLAELTDPRVSDVVIRQVTK